MAQLQLEENRKGKKGKERNWTENERNRKEQKRKEKKGIGQKMSKNRKRDQLGREEPYCCTDLPCNECV